MVWGQRYEKILNNEYRIGKYFVSLWQNKKMKKKTSKILKILAGVALSLLLLPIIAIVLLNTEAVQQRIMSMATEMLSEKLETRVSIESVDIGILGGYVHMYGVEIDDQQQRKMLRTEKLSANIVLLQLLKNRIVVEEVELKGLDALLTKKTDSIPANYQFLIDAFKKDKKPVVKDSVPTQKKARLTFDVRHVKLSRIHINYDKYDFQLHAARYDNKHIQVDSIQAAWIAEKKKGPMDNLLFIRELKATQEGSVFEAQIQGLHFRTDNHKPRKNAGKPKRGFFDVGHLNITANAKLTIDASNKDSLRIALNECTATDTITGMDFRDLRAKATYTKGRLHLQDIDVQQIDTKLHIATADMLLPNKKEGTKLLFTTGTITGRAVLKNIARPFSLALNRFTLPLNLSLNMSGTDSTLSFRNVQVYTDDKKLTISAVGDITHLKEKELLDVHFHVSRMRTTTGMAEQVINQFAVKKLMMKQLKRLGTISYTGDFHVLYRKEQFQGQLLTNVGSMNFSFYIDENNKYLVGQASTKNLALGNVMDLNKLGNIEASAKFNIDISKPRTAIMRRKKGGKLPIGTVNATVDDCSFMGIHVRRLTADITSDGAVATGDVKQLGKHRDLFFSFSFTNTDDMSKMKITHPGIKFHGLSDEDKKAKEEKKLQKKLQKEEKKRQQEDGERLAGKKKKKFLLF